MLRHGQKYILSMFPYPSGRLHMGHLRVYTISDVLSRYYALKGYRVIHPIGWDAFGLPAENAAREKGIDPAQWTYKNIEEMRSQLIKTNVNFDWDREIFTCKPEYFRWTQWIFLQLFKHGLVRKTFSEVNWDPVDRTVLADEQVDENGCSWRSGAIVEKRQLCQWAIDTPRYAKRLLDGLSSLEFDWRGVVDVQSDWIGICDVYRFLLQIEVPMSVNNSNAVDNEYGQQFDLRLTNPAHLASAQFVIINTEHSIAKQAAKQGKLLDGEPFTILDNLCLINFVTGQRLPVVVVKILRRTNDPFILNARLGNSSSSDSLDRAVSTHLCLGTPPPEAITGEEVLQLAKQNQLGGYQTSRTLRDWVVSRQRGWGTPIPMLLTEEGGSAVAPVAENVLPILSEMRGQRIATDSFSSGWGRVETDTLDTYFDSSWYFLRFLNPNNAHAPFDTDIVSRHMPVNIYVGGMEHAKMHLFFARFITHFLHDIGMLPNREPFEHFIQLGAVRAPTYKLPDGKYVPESEVDGNKKVPGARLVHKADGLVVKKEFEKMSKSKHNGVDPMSVIDSFGVDQSRMQLLIEARPSQPIDWPHPYPTHQLKSINRWIGRTRSAVGNYVAARSRELSLAANSAGIMPSSAIHYAVIENADKQFRNLYNAYVRKVSIYLEVMHFHNMALTRLHHFTKALARAVTSITSSSGNAYVVGQSAEYERCLHAMLIMAQVFAPSLASELWAKFQEVPKLNDQLQLRAEKPLTEQEWPKLDLEQDTDFLLVLFGTVCFAQVPTQTISAMHDAELELYARQHCYARFFQLLHDREIPIRSSRIERIPELCIALHLVMPDEVHKRRVIEIIQQIGMERRANDGGSMGNSVDNEQEIASRG